ncbi:unnamed protein product [Eruca vesicaria subsp. sativa]|uniref:Ubiquitin-like domain-containing protein n=1 Tax=Eruca vesicaria subsp. sativa TaxID=29727 RepID=A0ABC8LXP6_ERUVS|nr:unnamed protein product [Eruca vesicaria subsp. sativa]
MKIFVKTLKCARFEIQVNPEDSVVDVKTNIETVLGATAYPASEQILIHKGKVLKDETTVEANQVSENSNIAVMKRKPASIGTSTSSASLKPQAHATETTGPAASNVNYGRISESNVQQILGMVRGAWSRELVADALCLAYNDLDKALEYLYFVSSFSETCAHSIGTQENTQQPEVPQGAVQEWSLDTLRNNPEFEYLQALVQSDPSLLQDILEVIEEQNPQLVQMILDNKADFLRFVLEQPQEELQGGDSGNQVGESEDQTEVEHPQADQTNTPNHGGDGANQVGDQSEETEVETPKDAQA